MSILEWKKLNFFRLIPEADHKKIKLCVKSKITAYISNSVYKILCDDLGGVHIFFRNWESISFLTTSWPVVFGALVTECNSLVTLSNSDISNEVIVKVWDLSKITKRNGAPCIGTAIIQSTSSASAMSATYNSSYFYISVGFERGELTLFRGPVARDFSAGFRNFQISTRRITGIEFKKTNLKHPTMFVCTHAGIFCFNLTENNDIREALMVLDSRNDPARCCALQIGETDDQYFIVGRDDAVYCYTNEGRGPCYAIEGQKLYLAKLGNYLIIVINLTNTTTLIPRKYLLIIIDVHHKIIVLNKPMESIAGVLFENKNCFILTESNQLFAVYEKDTNTKLELLLKKHLYDISLRLIEQENCDEKLRARVYKLYGDHLYLKGDLPSAIEKYIHTIGLVEPYCIIQKFIDSKSVGYLLEYMEALLKTEFATEEHIQLYLNCNSRIRLPVKLREFLSDVDKENNSYNDIYCSLSENNTTLGQSNNTLLGQDSDVKTQIYDGSIAKFLSIIDKPSEAENFLCRLHEHQIYSFFKEHSQTLMQFHPKQTTDILKFICGKNNVQKERQVFVSSPELFIPLFIGHEIYCKDFLMYLIHVILNCQPVVYNYLFELHLQNWKAGKEDTEKLIQFLEQYHRKYNEHHVLILCKLYSFLDGVLYFFKNNDLYNLSVQYYLKSGDFKNIYSCLKSAKVNIPSLRDIDLSAEGSTSLINFILNENLKNKTNSSLQVFQNISEIEKIKVGHVKEFYSQQLLLLANDLENDSKTVDKLNNELRSLKEILEGFRSKAFEIRCQICDICKLQIKHPAVYFLCQHSFHKHCLNLYAEDKLVCVVCNTKSHGKYNETLENYEGLSDLTESKDYIAFIEKSLRKGIFNNLNPFSAESTKQQLIGNNPFETSDNLTLGTSSFYKTKAISLNPFETDEEIITANQYDANLNPFEE